MSEGIHSGITEELRSGKTVVYFTVGISMQPLLATRKTHVMIAPLEKAEKNDILLYVRDNGALVLHRLMKQDENFYYMRGDNTYERERIRKEQAFGVVTHIYRKGKTFAVRESRGYRAYVAIWRFIYPVRWVLYKIRFALYKMKMALKRSK